MRLDIYDRRTGQATLIGAIRLEGNTAKFDPQVEWIKKMRVPPPLTPNDGEAYVRSLAALLRRGSYVLAKVVEDDSAGSPGE